MRKKTIGFFICTLLIATTVPASGVLNIPDTLSTDWLIMIYLDGDNDKWDRAAADLNEILTPRIAPHVDITILYDSNDAEDVSGTILYHMKGSTISEYMLPWGGGATELNMADGDTLENFVDWSLDHFQADRNMLVIWDHGGSWKGCCEDVSDGGDWLRPDEMRNAFDNALGSLDLDILYFAACYMADVEICYELRNYADYYIGSEYVGWMGGSTYGMYCDFNNLILGINADNSDPVEDISQNIIDIAIAPNCVTYLPEKSHTFAVMKLDQMNSFINTLDSFAQNLIDHFTDPTLNPQYTTDIIASRGNSPSWSNSKRTDIQDFAERLGNTVIPNALDDLIVYEWHHEGTDDATVAHAHGLHIVFPKKVGDFDSRYINYNWIENFRNACAWDEWLSVFYETILVDDDFTSSTPCYGDTTFNDINDAITVAADSETIWVFNGEYDNTVFVDKTVNLCGAGDQVIIVCDTLTYGMMIYSDWVNVTGFTIENSLYGYWGIHINADHCTIKNNIIIGLNTYGIYLLGASDNTITGNWLESNDYGVYLVAGSNDNLIYNNYFNNTINAYDNGLNQWNITKMKQKNIIGWPWTAGNYWSDYYGKDTDPTISKDALGDSFTPHNCSGNIQHGGDRKPLLRTVCMDVISIGLAKTPGLYVLGHRIPVDIFKQPVVFGPVDVPIDIMDEVGAIIDKITVTVNGRKIWEVDGPLVEPPVHHWNTLAFGKCEYVLTTTDTMDNTVQHTMTTWKFF